MEYRNLHNIPYSQSIHFYFLSLRELSHFSGSDSSSLLCHSLICYSIDHLPVFLLDLPFYYSHYLFYFNNFFIYFIYLFIFVLR